VTTGAMPVVGRNLHAGADSMWRRSNTTTRPDALDMQLRRRLTFTLLTPVLQIVSAVALAAAFASVTEDDLSGRGDLIGLLVGLVVKGCLIDNCLHRTVDRSRMTHE